MLQAQLVGVRYGVEVLEQGLSTIGAERPDARARMAEVRDFFAFCERDARELVQRWEAQRHGGG